MKIIFSRKGFDSTFGNFPNPILPNGEMISFPIPMPDGSTEDSNYSNLQFQGKSYLEIINELNSKSAKRLATQPCHIDPDLENRYIQLANNWKPAFGQIGISERHLEKRQVGKGDVFLFFGWFRQTEYINGKLQYKKDAPDIHAIYGYMEIAERITDDTRIKAEYPYHPHAHFEHKENNALYIPSDSLSISPDKKGYGLLPYSDVRCLTAKDSAKRGIWTLPDCFRNIKISYHSGKNTGFIDDTNYFHSAARGQEFVCECNDNEEIMDWLKNILLT